MPTLLTDENPYVRDFIEDLPALTRKNADFMEAVVRLDSSYRRDFDPSEGPEAGFDPERDVHDAKGKYCGSIAFWFARMETHPEEFARCLLGATISIDSSNTTHLESSIDGRLKMREFLLECCQDVEGLKRCLLVPFRADDRNHIISRLTVPIKAVKDEQNRCNISFASKFCAYGALFLGLDIAYSKYDGVVSENLPRYVSVYLGERVGKRRYIASSSYESKLNVYEDYSKAIGRLIEASGSQVSRDELDHIIWYAFK